MRCFISLDIPEKIIKEISKIQNQLPDFIGKKTELKNLHLTLKFLGGVDENKLEKVKSCLEKISFKKFETKIKTIGVFSEKHIRIIWLSLVNCEKLQKEIDNSLKELFEKEKRFMGHLTIARVKKIKNKNEFLEKLNKIKIQKIKFEIDKFKLKSSVLKPEGPFYEDVQDYYLN